MISWHILLILLIPVVVVILASVLRGVEQKNQKDRSVAASGEARLPTRRPITDLDRFLDEARRRRDPTQRREVSVAGEGPPVAVPVPAARPQKLARPAPTRPREVRPPQPRKPVLLEEAVESRPQPSATVQVPVPTAEPVRAAEVTPIQMPAPAPAPAVRATIREKDGSPVFRQVAQALRTPRSAAMAIVLREVFDPPLCKRRR